MTTDEKYKNRYRVSSARSDWHAYDGGFYHVTVCTKDRELYFGEIVEGVMRLSEIGKYAEEQFQNVTSYYSYAEIPVFIVMPNHIHAIVVIDNRTPRRDAIHRVSDIHRVKEDMMDDPSMDSKSCSRQNTARSRHLARRFRTCWLFQNLLCYCISLYFHRLSCSYSFCSFGSR